MEVVSFPCAQSWYNELQTCFNILLFVTTCTHTCTYQFTADHEIHCRDMAERVIRKTKKRAEGKGSQSFTTSTLLSASLSVFWVTAPWSEVNYSKRLRVLASARYHQENHQLCRRRFLISSTQSSAPETVASTHLIEAHLALDVMIGARVSGRISSPALPEALNATSVWRDTHLLQPELKEQ